MWNETYSSCGAPTIVGTHANSANNAVYGDLGFCFLYVGEFDVRGTTTSSSGCSTYTPATTRWPSAGSSSPIPTGRRPNLYAANNPVTTIDPDGTRFIVCAVIGAAVSVAIYAVTTDNFDLGEAAKEAVIGDVAGMTGVVHAVQN